MSSAVGNLVKPDEAAFLKVMRQLDAEAESLWFFDDSPPYIEAARRLGSKSFPVEGLPIVECALADATNIAGGPMDGVRSPPKGEARGPTP